MILKYPRSGVPPHDAASEFAEKQWPGQVRAVNYVRKGHYSVRLQGGRIVGVQVDDALCATLVDGTEAPQGPTYNHTRGDSPLTPCDICRASALRATPVAGTVAVFGRIDTSDRTGRYAFLGGVRVEELSARALPRQVRLIMERHETEVHLGVLQAKELIAALQEFVDDAETEQTTAQHEDG